MTPYAPQRGTGIVASDPFAGVFIGSNIGLPLELGDQRAGKPIVPSEPQ